MKRLALLVLLGFTLIITQALEVKAARKPREITQYPFSGLVDDIRAMVNPTPLGIRAIRSMTFKKRYLLMPSTNDAPRRHLSIIVDGQVVRELLIYLGDANPDYWVWIDISEFKGKRATLILNNPDATMEQLKPFYQDDNIRVTDELYKEKHRQQFHFSAMRGWNNDPNGLVYYKGEYHLFWQHNPYGWKWGNMTWGHAVSTDCIHWKELGDVLHPDRLGVIYSGSAIIDHNNSAGFQTGDEKTMIAFYTSAGGAHMLISRNEPKSQSMAYSNDLGRTWTKYSGNPIIEYFSPGNRDPKVFWHAPTNRWVMALFVGDGKMGFLSSTDLKNWTRHSEIKCFHECPELFELPIDGDKSNTKWGLYGGSGDYLLGNFDGKAFKPDTGKIRYRYGNCFYASQTFNNMPKSDPRRIQIAWGKIDTPGMPFNQCMLFPVNLTLRTTDQGVRMFAEPIAEIKNIHGKKRTWKDEIFMPGQGLLSGLTGRLFHIRGTFSLSSTANMSFVIRGTEVNYDAEEESLSCKGKSAKLKPENGKITLEILVDFNSIEIFANNGRIYMPIGGVLPQDNKKLELSSEAAEVKVDQLEIYELNAIWK